MACCISMEHLMNIGAAQTTLHRRVTLIYLCSFPKHLLLYTIQPQYCNFYFHMSKNWKKIQQVMGFVWPTGMCDSL
jgi:hypothetical protein